MRGRNGWTDAPLILTFSPRRGEKGWKPSVPAHVSKKSGVLVLPALVLLLSFFWPAPNAGAWLWSKKEAAPAEQEQAASPEPLAPAFRDLREGRWSSALEGFWQFRKDKAAYEEGAAPAELGMARACLALGLRQAATEYCADLVRDSMDMDLSVRALEVLERFTREEVFDEETIVEELLYEKDFSALPASLNNFVHYHQARMDYRNGHPRWAEHHLDKMEGEDDYFSRGKILSALWALKQGDANRCRSLLEGVLQSPGLDRATGNEARKALARVLYEQEDFAGAYRIYREIEAPETLLADVILEEAWAKFREEDYRKSMGLLVAFSAPSFRNLFKPEQYLLKALIYMQYCHYGAARSTLEGFRGRYGETLRRIRSREDLAADPESARVLKSTPAIARMDAYLKSLDAEAATLEKLPLSEPLKQGLARMYALDKERAERRREREWEREVESVKEVLFDAEEQMNLVQFEAGMNRYEKVRKLYYQEESADGAAPRGKVPPLSSNAYYRFRGEFWTDELDDYTFFIEDYCKSPGEWETEP
ncbi:MAG: hypothetical protein AB1640_09320 [bacterium]